MYIIEGFMKHTQEITDLISPDGIKKLKKGQTLTFDFEGSKTTYKITCIKNERIWVKETKLFRPEEITIKDIKANR